MTIPNTSIADATLTDEMKMTQQNLSKKDTSPSCSPESSRPKLALWLAVFLLAGTLLLAGCGGSSEPTSPQAETPLPAEAPLPPPPLPEGGLGGAEPINDAQLPELVKTSVFQDIETTHNVPSEDLVLIGARPESWPDGCLGLGGPDEICTFAIVDGWEVTASQGNNLWVYRTSADAALIREVDVPETESF